MNRSKTLKRRKFLEIAAGVAASGSAISCSRSRSPWRFFTVEEARTVAAICEQIIPADQDPGATWAGVVNYIDRQLLLHFKEFQQVYRKGISAVEQTSLRLRGKSFTELSSEQQTVLLAIVEKNEAPGDAWKGVEQRQFFNLIVDHTMQGFYGNPRHGGNRDTVSWKMIGVPEPPIRGRLHYEFPSKAATTGRRRLGTRRARS
jgi:gluconate 2-dehydrogenase gamma chain